MSGMLNHGPVTLCTFHKQTCLLVEFECVSYTKSLFLFSLKRGNFPFWLICKVRYRRCCQKNVVFLQLKVGQSYAFHWLYRSNLIQLLCTQKSWFYHFQTYDGQWNGSKKDHVWKTPQLILAILGLEILQMLSEIRHLGLSRTDLFRFSHSPNRHNQNEAPLWYEMSEQCLAWRE